MKKEILELQAKLSSANIDTGNLAYIPVVPICGIHEVVIEEHFGMKVIKLIAAPDDDCHEDKELHSYIVGVSKEAIKKDEFGTVIFS